jgi:hypothetical protein
MKVGHGVLALALALAPAAYAAPGGQSQQPEPPPRRPQGPAAGPVIKLPPGAVATEERAQKPAAKEEAAPTKWEYCYIRGFAYRQTGFSSSSPRVAVVYVHYLPEGFEEVEGPGEEGALGNALARLGDDGWELTAIRTDLQLQDGNGKATSVYFFKRPKRQE